MPYRNPASPAQNERAHDVSAAAIRVPRGELTRMAGEPVRVTLRVSDEARKTMQELLSDCRALSEARFLLPGEPQGSSSSIELTYPVEPPGTLPMSAVLPLWRRRLDVHLPLALAFVRFLIGAIDELRGVGFDPVSFAPLQVRMTPERPGAFRILLLPIVEAELADWAQSSPEAWGWMWRGAMLGHRPKHATTYALASALGACIAAPASAEFERTLRGQSLSASRIREPLSVALPPGFEREIDGLSGLLEELTVAGGDEPKEDWRRRLVGILDQLHSERLITRWEHAGRHDTALRIVDDLAANLPAAEVPWRLLARLRNATGDSRGGVMAQLADLDARPTPETMRDTLRMLRALDPRDARRAHLIGEATARISKLEIGQTEAAQLKLADLEARCAGRRDAAQALLKAQCTDPYCEGARLLLCARLFAEAGDYPRTSLMAKQASARMQVALSKHGDAARYAMAYLSYLDGVANYGAIGTIGDPSYLADSYEQLVKATDAASDLDALGAQLVDGCVAWLQWIVRYAAAIRAPAFDVVRAGVSAYLGARGVAMSPLGAGPAVQLGPPPLLWYDVDLVLPLGLGEPPWT